ncbi:MAG TPA: DUF4349 domain-containing protein [Thermoanaerobaculia bacterium]|nr:DUF4349 domain-containing protein [Thermoanaerobaculia bacterium]
MRLAKAAALAAWALCFAGCARKAAPNAAPRPSNAAPAAMEAGRIVPGSSAGAHAEQPGEARAPKRMIVRTAQMSVVVGDPAGAAKSLGELVEANGGFVSESKQWRDGEQVRAALVFRVPVKQLFPTLEAIRKRAIRVESENVSGQDVTAEYVDLGAQVTNLEATEKELRELLSTVRQRTQKAADILEVFTELTKIRGEIERAKTRMGTLSQLADLSTINLELVPDALSKPIAEGEWRPLTVVRSAIRSLVSTAQWLFDALIWVVLYLVPLLLLLAIPLWAIRAGWRAYRRSKAND